MWGGGNNHRISADKGKKYCCESYENDLLKIRFEWKLAVKRPVSYVLVSLINSILN